ncbi:LysE family translocator [Aquabacterium sp.]|uniref:LysE family translocator n=1 Tax=Aquabacterium sp. TaxID=1872578 RepID=UPI0039C87E7B
MEGIHDLPLFIGAGLLLNITPGADVALIAARSSAQGFRAGAAAALGVGAGCMLHALAAALGVSALLAGSATAFTVVRWVGAAYLVWLGLSMLRARAPSPGGAAAAPPPPMRWARVFAQGFLTNALNPKVALFFLAFVPQFIDAQAPNKALAFVMLGLIFNVNGTLVNLGFAWGISALRARLRGGKGRIGPIAVWLTRGAGVLFVALGLRLALAAAPER